VRGLVFSWGSKDDHKSERLYVVDDVMVGCCYLKLCREVGDNGIIKYLNSRCGCPIVLVAY
jgi:hypothetical protein